MQTLTHWPWAGSGDCACPAGGTRSSWSVHRTLLREAVDTPQTEGGGRREPSMVRLRLPSALVRAQMQAQAHSPGHTHARPHTHTHPCAQSAMHNLPQPTRLSVEGHAHHRVFVNGISQGIASFRQGGSCIQSTLAFTSRPNSLHSILSEPHDQTSTRLTPSLPHSAPGERGEGTALPSVSAPAPLAARRP